MNFLFQMTDRRLQPTPAALTGLFNACAESPFREYALKKARLLKEKIETKQWIVNLITYRAMVKAFGRCGDIDTAFQVRSPPSGKLLQVGTHFRAPTERLLFLSQIVDEMVKAGYRIDVETYSFLLMSCVADKESGFTYAVQVSLSTILHHPLHHPEMGSLTPSVVSRCGARCVLAAARLTSSPSTSSCGRRGTAGPDPRRYPVSCWSTGPGTRRGPTDSSPRPPASPRSSREAVGPSPFEPRRPAC